MIAFRVPIDRYLYTQSPTSKPQWHRGVEGIHSTGTIARQASWEAHIYSGSGSSGSRVQRENRREGGSEDLD